MQNVLVAPKGEKGPVGARLFVVLARKSHTAVIFRRGPSKWVQVGSSSKNDRTGRLQLIETRAFASTSKRNDTVNNAVIVAKSAIPLTTRKRPFSQFTGERTQANTPFFPARRKEFPMRPARMPGSVGSLHYVQLTPHFVRDDKSRTSALLAGTCSSASTSLLVLGHVQR
jgi:hypothetical protein